MLGIQEEVNRVARDRGMPEVVLINHEERQRIEKLIAVETWPKGWDGTETQGDVMMPDILPDGSIQHLLIEEGWLDSPPFPISLPADSNVEMSWQVFGGSLGDFLLVALKQRCYDDELGSDSDTLATQFRLHLHRGIGYLSADSTIRDIESFFTDLD